MSAATSLDEQIRKSLDDWADGILTDRELIGKVQQAVNWQTPNGWIEISGGTGPVASTRGSGKIIGKPNPSEQIDAVKEEARELLTDFPEVADAAYNIEHALFADAIERQRNSPFWGHSKKIARVYARAPELLKTLVGEVERLRKQVKQTERDAREDARDGDQ